MKDIFSFLEKVSHTSDLIRGSRHAAALVYKGRVIALGNNRLKTHPLQQQYGKNEHSIFLHAEIDAIIRALRDYGPDVLKKSSLYVLRTTKTGRVKNSEPCSGCLRAIEAFDIQKVYHT
jgi:tRNA(Arg) A34 adenosine deaminase TadA